MKMKIESQISECLSCLEYEVVMLLQCVSWQETAMW